MFYIGQIFEKTYTPDVAMWCNSNNCYIEEIQPLEDGTRQFEIKEVLPYTPPIETEEERKARINSLTLNSTTFYKEVLRTSNKSSNDIQQLIQNNTTLTNYQKESLFIDLQKSYTLVRGSYFVITLGTLLNYTSEDLDYLFEHKVFNF